MRSIRDKMTDAPAKGLIKRRATMATSAILAAALLGTSAYAQGPAQSKSSPAQTMQQDQNGPIRVAEWDRKGGGHGWRKGREHRGPGRGGWRHHGPRHGMMMSPAKLAGALAAFETGVGIQPDQMATWRKFTGALIAFSEAVQPPHGRRMGPRMDDRERGPAGQDADASAASDADGPGESQAAPGVNGDQGQNGRNGLFAFRMLDRFADRAIVAGEKAQTLKSALADLETTLTPEQMKTARGLIRSMMRDMRREARWEHHGPRHHKGHWRGGHHRGPRGPMPAEAGPSGPGADTPAEQAPDAAPADEQEQD